MQCLHVSVQKSVDGECHITQARNTNCWSPAQRSYNLNPATRKQNTTEHQDQAKQKKKHKCWQKHKVKLKRSSHQYVQASNWIRCQKICDLHNGKTQLIGWSLWRNEISTQLINLYYNYENTAENNSGNRAPLSHTDLIFIVGWQLWFKQEIKQRLHLDRGMHCAKLQIAS